MIELAIKGVGLVAPGMESWQAARAVLRGERGYEPAELGKLAPSRLPGSARRRASPVTRLAITAACDALAEDADASAIPAIFASSEGDLETTDALCRSMTAEEPWASPMRFHSAVHNAAVGYWSIACGTQANTTALSAYDHSCGAGLLEAATQITVDGLDDCLLAVYDEPAPEPLASARPLTGPFAFALWLGPPGTGERDLNLDYARRDRSEPLEDAALERMRTGNPAARGLPLLCALAREAPAAVSIACPGGAVAIKLGGVSQ